jgi:hypothetical protein
MSGNLDRYQGHGVYDYTNIVSPNKDAIKSNITIEANSSLDIFTANVATQNFNVIQVSMDTFYEADPSKYLNVNIKQGLHPDHCTTSYQTPVKGGVNFFRNYPVKNNFMNVNIENPFTTDTNCNVVITLSKFTQFNPPSQIGDQVKFKEMTNLNRNANKFYDDVARDKFESVEVINRTGSFRTGNSTAQILAPIQVLPNLSNSYAEVYCQSDSISDTFEIALSGDTDVGADGRIENQIELFGTSMSEITLNRFKSIDTVDLRGNNNSGNITVYHSGTNKLLNYIPKDYANTSACLYYVESRATAVLKQVHIDGFTQLTPGKVRLNVLDHNTGVITHWDSVYNDGNISNDWYPDLFIDSNSTVYLEVQNDSGGTETSITGSIKLILYYNTLSLADSAEAAEEPEEVEEFEIEEEEIPVS